MRTYVSIPLEIRFWSKVDFAGPDECWNWMAGTDSAGYGKIGEGGRGGKIIRSSRLSWEFLRGRIPQNRMVCHNCDNPLCVNPNHLYLGTPQSNMDDRANRGRMPVGSALPQSKLTERQVAIIKRTIGRIRFNASPSTVSHILSGKQWRHVLP